MAAAGATAASPPSEVVGAATAAAAAAGESPGPGDTLGDLDRAEALTAELLEVAAATTGVLATADAAVWADVPALNARFADTVARIHHLLAAAITRQHAVDGGGGSGSGGIAGPGAGIHEAPR